MKIGKEPTFDDVKAGLNNLFTPFKDLYNKGKDLENEIWTSIKPKK